MLFKTHFSSEDYDVTTLLQDPVKLVMCLCFHSQYKQIQHVNELIQLKPDINSMPDGYTPLISAIGGGHEEVVRILINAGAEVNIADRTRTTPLIYAVGNGSKQIIAHLLKHGADINAANASGQSPLWLAVSQNKRRLIKDLLKAGADIHQGDLTRKTPLDMAFKHQDPWSIVKELLNAGAGLCANLNLPTSQFKQTPFSNEVVIGLTFNNVAVTRETPGFENAITNIVELRDAINKNTVPDRELLLLACNQILKKDPNQSIFKQIKWELSNRNKPLLDLCLKWFNKPEHSSYLSEALTSDRIPEELKGKLDPQYGNN